MVIWMLGCGPGPSPVSTVEGVQVVGIETFPPQPTLVDFLRLKAWVAEGRGYGADVLLWMCTPVDGECLEAYPPGTLGLPLQLWTFHGVADPVLDVTSAWPTLIGLAQALSSEADGASATRARTSTATTFEAPEPIDGLIVWALACVPGACPIVDAVAHDPVAGSEAWTAIVHDLANPEEWLDEIPPGEASLAVKVVPFQQLGPAGDSEFAPTTATDGLPNRAPEIRVLPDGRIGRDAALVAFEVTDPDEEDELLQRVFATAGAVELSTSGGGGAATQWLTWRGPGTGEPATLFLVAEDGLGGTTVWSSVVETGTCGDPPAIEIRHASGGAIDAGETLLLDTAFGGSFRASGRLTGFPVAPSQLDLRVTDGSTYGSGAAAMATWSTDTCSGTFEDAVITVVPVSGSVLDTVCTLGGSVVRLSVEDPSTNVSAEVDVVVTLDDAWPCLF